MGFLKVTDVIQAWRTSPLDELCEKAIEMGSEAGFSMPACTFIGGVRSGLMQACVTMEKGFSLRDVEEKHADFMPVRLALNGVPLHFPPRLQWGKENSIN